MVSILLFLYISYYKNIPKKKIQMRTISETLRVSLDRINEGKFNNVIIVYSSDDPEGNNVFINLTRNDINQLKKLFNGYGCYILEINSPTNLIRVSHSDEDGEIVSVGNNINDMKTRTIKDIKNALKLAADNGYRDGDNLLIETPMVGGLDINYRSGISPNNIYKDFEEYVATSVIDGDSEAAVCILDLNKRECVFGSGMNFYFYNSFEEYKSEMGFE